MILSVSSSASCSVECPQINISPVLMLSLICFAVVTKVYEHICTSFVMWHAASVWGPHLKRHCIEFGVV